MYWTDVVTAIASAVAALATILGVWIGIGTYLQSKNFEFEAERPFIIPSYETIDSPEGKKLYLVLANVGDTPAQNVRLEFTSVGEWNWVRSGDYPFDKAKGGRGIAAIGPGERVRYFAGVMRDGNPISDLDTRDVEGVVSFDNPRNVNVIEDKFRISLVENRYKAR